MGVYTATKASVIQLTRVMAAELRPFNIQVNGLSPGIMDTKMQEQMRNPTRSLSHPDIYEEFVSRRKPKHLLPSPEKAARLAVFLASEDSNAITGEVGTIEDYQRFGYAG